MKKFEAPEIKIISIDVEDIITVSESSPTTPEQGDNETGFQPFNLSITD